ERATDGADEIEAGRQADLRIAQMQLRARFQRPRDRAGERHLESVEDPCDAERGDDERVEAAPGQAVEPGRNVGRSAGVGHRARRLLWGWNARLRRVVKGRGGMVQR